MEFEILTTQRLKLIAFTPEVYHYAFTTLTEEEIKKRFGHADHEAYLVEKDRFDKGMTTFNKSFLFFQLRDKTTDAFLGWCGFHTWYYTHFRAEIFYMLNNEQDRQQGLMTEAMLPVLNYAFTKMNLVRVEAFVGESNAASVALLKKFGFVPEGCFRKHYHYQGENTNSLAFGLLKEEFEAMPKTS